MKYSEVIQALKDRLQIDPCAGSRWTETDDIEQGVYWAGRIGRGFVGDVTVTYAEGHGYAIVTEAASRDSQHPEAKS